ncbi:alpha/beta hydrolase [Glacieibacterium frigidum]|uniref:Alpha/beta hydrolase n=2 Tax=Glacieibacterium frigidum TaxID=2593303 RepID=A0A552UJJ5_9SPHN|nr:alpha/beta hydrolase [Glacieibacterium frigidum]
MSKFGMAVALGALALAGSATAQPAARPTIILVHGAFAGSSSWNAVVSELQAGGYRVIAAANPLRSVAGDGDYVARLTRSIDGPVVLVGHSYGGEVINAAAADAPNVKALVFVAGFAPETGESAVSLGNQFPTGTLGQTLTKPVPQADGRGDVYIDQAKFHAQFAADVPLKAAMQMAATQRPIPLEALGEASAAPATWKTLPSYFIYGSLDKNIPAALHAFMAKRAGAKATVAIAGASHVVMVSHPREVARMIERAAGQN